MDQTPCTKCTKMTLSPRHRHDSYFGHSKDYSCINTQWLNKWRTVRIGDTWNNSKESVSYEKGHGHWLADHRFHDRPHILISFYCIKMAIKHNFCKLIGLVWPYKLWSDKEFLHSMWVRQLSIKHKSVKENTQQFPLELRTIGRGWLWSYYWLTLTERNVRQCCNRLAILSVTNLTQH